MAAASAARRIAVVTGGNKGIGYECCRLLAGTGAQYDVILAARSEERGKAAVAKLNAAGVENVRWLAPLDISDGKSVEGFAEALEKGVGRLDILLNNAGLAFKGDTFDAESAQATQDVNFYGTMAVTERLRKLLDASPDGRIVNVCSQAGKLSQVSKKLQARVSAADATRDTLKAVAKEFVAGVADGTHRDLGFSNSMYGISKLLEIAYTRVLAADYSESKTMEVNACCPGWCNTDMSSGRGPRTPAKGAETPVWLCTRARTGTSGKFYYDLKPIEW